MAARLTGKDLLGPIVIFVGAALVIAAVALPFYLVDTLKKAPTDTDVTIVAPTVTSDGTANPLPATILNPCSMNSAKAEVDPAQLLQQQRLLVTKPTSSSTLTYQSGSTTLIEQIKNAEGTQTLDLSNAYAGCPAPLVTANVDQVTVNRKTGRPSGGQSQLQVEPSMPGQPAKAVQISGRQGQQYRFPFGTKKSDGYSFYDLDTRTSNPLKYVDSTDISGVNVYHFTQQVPETDLTTINGEGFQPPQGTVLQKPASWFGMPGIDPKTEITAHLYQSSTRDVWVDPDSGTIINMRQHITQTFKPAELPANASAAAKGFTLTSMDGTFSYDQQTQKTLASSAKKTMDRIHLWGRLMPIVFGIIGLVALAIGIWLTVRPQPERKQPRDDDGPSDLRTIWGETPDQPVDPQHATDPNQPLHPSGPTTDPVPLYPDHSTDTTQQFAVPPQGYESHGFEPASQRYEQSGDQTRAMPRVDPSANEQSEGAPATGAAGRGHHEAPEGHGHHEAPDGQSQADQWGWSEPPPRANPQRIDPQD